MKKVLRMKCKTFYRFFNNIFKLFAKLYQEIKYTFERTLPLIYPTSNFALLWERFLGLFIIGYLVIIPLEVSFKLQLPSPRINFIVQIIF